MESAHPDHRFIEALLNNDPLGVQEIYSLFSRKIIQVIRALSGSEEDAQDIMQEGLMAITMRARKDNFVLTCPFEAFLVLVCKNKWLNHVKGKRNERVTIALEEGSYVAAEMQVQALAEESLIQYDMYNLVHRSLGKLREDCRQILNLFYSGISLAEVSKMMGKSYEYIKNRRKPACEKKFKEYIRLSPEYKELGPHLTGFTGH